MQNVDKFNLCINFFHIPTDLEFEQLSFTEKLLYRFCKEQTIEVAEEIVNYLDEVNKRKLGEYVYRNLEW